MVTSLEAKADKAGVGEAGVGETDAGPGRVVARIAGAVAGTLLVLLVVLAIVRPDMMSMATVHRMMAAVGF